MYILKKMYIFTFMFQMIGKPYFPPYWSLGFQLCRYGYNNLTNLKAAVDRTIAAKIPLVRLSV
jgi:alpha-glucosidase (family GH31 glycosyl hydrolase)